MDYIIDAQNKRLGRVASEAATILQGKKSAAYEPRLQGADRVILKHWKEITVSGRKPIQKIYYRHTGYMGHLKETKFKDAFAKDPRKVVREVVRHMLPKNALNPKRLKNLIFEE